MCRVIRRLLFSGFFYTTGKFPLWAFVVLLRYPSAWIGVMTLVLFRQLVYTKPMWNEKDHLVVIGFWAISLFLSAVRQFMAMLPWMVRKNFILSVVPF